MLLESLEGIHPVARDVIALNAGAAIYTAGVADSLEAGVRKAHADLRADTVGLAILAAEKLLSRSLDDATQRRLVEEHLADLERRAGESSALPS
jgi:anthranilate phosphoribosyltransferase